LADLPKNKVFAIILGMTRAERREKRKEIAIQNLEFKKRLRPLIAKKYRTSLRYEDLLVADDGKAYVNVDLTKIESPFSIFSYDKRMDPDIFDYIDTQVFFLRAAIPIVINFDDGGKYNDELKDKIRKYVKRHYSLEYEDKRLENRKSIIFGLATILTGLLVLALHFLIMYSPNSKTGDVFNELTLIIAWMFIWQSLDNFLITGHNRRVDINNSGQLALAEVTFGKPRQ
jgi:hypothetical protein